MSVYERKIVKRTSIVVLLAAFNIAAIAAEEQQQQDPGNNFKIQLSGWSYGRERKTITGSNRVTATLTMKNTSAADIKNIVLTVNYATGMGDTAAAPVKKKAGDLKAGESRKTDVVAEFIPAFESYEITVEYDGGGKEQWFGNSDVAQPQAKTGDLAKGTADLLLLGREGGVDRSGTFNGMLRVRNGGSAEAKNMKYTITFYDAKKQKISEITNVLGNGKLAGGAEDKYPVSAPNCPRNYTTYNLRIVCDDTPPDAALSGGDFTNANIVEFANFSFKRKDPKSPDLIVSAQVRNGLPGPVEQVKLTMIFFGSKAAVDKKKKDDAAKGEKNEKNDKVASNELKRFVYDVPGRIEKGEVKAVQFSIPALPMYEEYEQLVDFKRLDGTPQSDVAAGAVPAGAPSGEATPVSVAEKPKFKNTKDVEIIFTQVNTNEDKSVALVGCLRNGRDSAVKDVLITAQFNMGSGDPVVGEKKLSDVIKPGEERNFLLKAQNAAGFKEYTFKFTEIEAK